MTKERQMRTTEDTEDMEPTIILPAMVDLAAADALLATLRQRLATGLSCQLDASNVEQLMLPGIQVILAAIRSSEKVQVVDPSASFRSAFDEAALSWVRGNEAEPARPEQAQAAVQVQELLREQLQEPEQEQVASDGPQPDLDAAPAQPQPSQEAQARKDEPRAAKRILTIDDSKTMRDMLRFTLVDAGYDVLQAVDGQDGLDVLRKERVDVVITDINMPKLDGYGVIRHLRADACYDDTPILVLSTECDQKTKDIGRDAGATGWLVKPFDPDQLVEIVKQVSP
jgi:two-component system, chemotaxis family, chemotaxis protein CheY